MKIQPYTVLSKKTLINEPYCRIDQHRVEFPSGGEGDWFVKISNDAVIVLPVLDTGEVVLQKTYKHGSEQVITECVAGLVDDGEDPKTAAVRELSEETGYVGGVLTKLGTIFADPTSSSMQYHLYLAEGGSLSGQQSLDEAEQIEVFTVKDIQVAKEYLNDPENMTSSATRAVLSYM